MAHRSREAVKLPNEDGIEAAPVRVDHQAVKFLAFLFCSRDANVDVLPGESPAAAFRILSKLARLHCWILAVVCRAHPGVDGNSHLLLQAGVRPGCNVTVRRMNHAFGLWPHGARCRSVTSSNVRQHSRHSKYGRHSARRAALSQRSGTARAVHRERPRYRVKAVEQGSAGGLEAGASLEPTISARMFLALSDLMVRAAFISLTFGLSPPACFTMEAFTRLKYCEKQALHMPSDW